MSAKAGMNLLSENDLRTLQTALDSRLEIEMTRRLNNVTVSARTVRVRGGAWPVWVRTILQVRRETGHIVTLQNFASLEEFRSFWKER